MSKQKINLESLAKELKVVSLDRQCEFRGGLNSIITLPSVTITASYIYPSFYFPSYGSTPSYSPSIGSGGSGGSSGTGTSTDGGSQVNDPLGLLDKTKTFLTQTISELKTMIDKHQVTGKGATDYLNVLVNAQNTLIQMANSDKKFNVSELADNHDDKLNAEVSYNKETGEFDFKIEKLTNANNNISLVIHELTHFQQLMTGQLWVENGNITGYDKTDELEAYRNQHIAYWGTMAGYYDLKDNYCPDGNHVITMQEILDTYPGIYNNLPTSEWDKPNDNSAPSSASSFYYNPNL